VLNIEHKKKKYKKSPFKPRNILSCEKVANRSGEENEQERLSSEQQWLDTDSGCVVSRLGTAASRSGLISIRRW
jgi:hypothetical protein